MKTTPLLKQLLYFRKRFFPLRLTILLLFLFYLIAERLLFAWPLGTLYDTPIQRLVHAACDKLEAATCPQCYNAMIQTAQAIEAGKLQRLLLPLESELPQTIQHQLQLKPSRADLALLFRAAQQQKLIPPSPDYRTWQRNMRSEALAEYRAFFDPMWQEVHRMITEEGVDHLPRNIEMIANAIFLLLLYFFFVVLPLAPFLPALLTSYLLGSLPRKSHPLVPVLLLIATAAGTFFAGQALPYNIYFGISPVIYYPAFLFYLAAAFLLGRRKPAFENNDAQRLRIAWTTAVSGLILLFIVQNFLLVQPGFAPQAFVWAVVIPSVAALLVTIFQRKAAGRKELVVS